MELFAASKSTTKFGASTKLVGRAKLMLSKERVIRDKRQDRSTVTNDAGHGIAGQTTAT